MADSYFRDGEAGMGLPRSNDGEARFSAYVEGLTSVIGHAGRAKPLRDYCLGLMMPCERKSVEPMAAITAPERTAAQHQSLLHFIGEGKWWDERVLAKVRELVLPEMERWRIERDYQELKQEVGLGHFEGRGWRGFHHHATLCIAAYGFLISERETIPPSGDRATTLYPQFALREGHQPRGSAVAA